MKELRNQTVVFFKTINRKYPDHHGGNTLTHMVTINNLSVVVSCHLVSLTITQVCQEGYYNMLTFMENPKNHTELDKNELEMFHKNDKSRTPLMLCFTPPSATVSAMMITLRQLRCLLLCLWHYCSI